MFIREGLLDPLSSALLNVMASRGEATADMKTKLIQILLIFCQVSQSDNHVRSTLGTRKIARRERFEMPWICSIELTVGNRSVACVRTTGIAASSHNAESRQTPVYELDVTRCLAERKRHRNPCPHSRRTRAEPS